MMPGIQHVSSLVRHEAKFITRSPELSRNLTSRSFEDLSQPSVDISQGAVDPFRNYFMSDQPRLGQLRPLEHDGLHDFDKPTIFKNVFNNSKKLVPNNFELALRPLGVNAVLPDEPELAEPIVRAVCKAGETRDLRGMKILCSDEGDKFLSAGHHWESMTIDKDKILIRKNLTPVDRVKAAINDEIDELRPMIEPHPDSVGGKLLSQKVESLERKKDRFRTDEDYRFLTTAISLGHLVHLRVSPEIANKLKRNDDKKYWSTLMKSGNPLQYRDPKISRQAQQSRAKAIKAAVKRINADVESYERDAFGKKVSASASVMGKKFIEQTGLSPYEFVAEAFASKLMGKELTKPQKDLSRLLGLPL